MVYNFNVGDKVVVVHKKTLENKPFLENNIGVITDIVRNVNSLDHCLAHITFENGHYEGFYFFRLAPALCEVTGKLNIVGDI